MSQLAQPVPWTNETSGKLDCYLQAAIATGFSDYDIGDPLSPSISIAFSIKVNVGTSHQQVLDTLTHWFSTSAGSRLTLAHLLTPGRQNYFATADVSFTLMEQLAKASFVQFIELCSQVLPLRPVTRGLRRPSGHVSNTASIGKIDSSEVLLGIIDHGCPFAHLAFRSKTGKSRIRAVWDQDDHPDFPGCVGTVPGNFGYGRQIDGSAIDAFLIKATVHGKVNEDLCYQLAEYGAMAGRGTHGSHTLGLMASCWRSPSLAKATGLLSADIASESDAVFVQLPREVVMTPASGAIHRFVLDGLRYLVESAGSTVERIVAVVDYGGYTGPHDGSSLFERAVDALISEVKGNGKVLEVVFPSGNGYDKQVYARIRSLDANVQSLLDWWIPPANDVPTFAEVWISTSSIPVQFTLTAPGQNSFVPMLIGPGGSGIFQWPDSHWPLVTVVVRAASEQTQLLIQIAPTGVDKSERPVAPNGRWTLGFLSETTLDASIDTYTTWGGRNVGFPIRVHPTKLFVPKNQSINVEIRGAGTVLGSGCGERTWVIGGYKAWSPYERAQYSGAGSVRGGKRSGTGEHALQGVGLAAISEESPGLHGVLSIGNRSGTQFRLIGTSVAAPQAARLIAQHRQLPVLVAPSPSINRYGKTEYGEWRLI